MTVPKKGTIVPKIGTPPNLTRREYANIHLCITCNDSLSSVVFGEGMMKFIEENWEEFSWGFLLGLGFMVVIGVNALILALVTGILWRLGGMGLWGTKAWRRFGVPIVILLCIRPITWLSLVASVLSVGVLSRGYGTKSLQPPDEGSPLGNFWLDRLGEKWGSVASRLTIIIGIWTVWCLPVIAYRLY